MIAKEDLERMYLGEWMNAYEIAEKLGVSRTTVTHWLKLYKILIRTPSESKLKKGVVKPTKEDLERMYLKENMSTYEIGEYIGVGGCAVGKWLKKYGIPIRTTSESMLKKGVVKPTKEVLERMYLEEWMNPKEIGDKIGVDKGSIRNWLISYGIPMRGVSEARLKGVVKPTKEVLERMYLNQWMSTVEIGEKIGVGNPIVGIWLKEYEIPTRGISEARLKGVVKPTKEVLERMYLEKNMSPIKIGAKLGVDGTTIRKWLQEYEFQIRSASEALLGERSPKWMGGISFEPYCPKFNKSFKGRVREFFGRVCFNCGKSEKDNIKKLSVHHVNYEKMVCCNDVKPLFVSLCASCHAKTNHNREYWEEKFTNDLIEKHNGECYLPLVIG